MWNRQGKDQADPHPAPDRSEDAGSSPWELWEEKWAGTEQERVALWLQSKVGSRNMATVDVRDDRVSAMASHRGAEQANAGPRELDMTVEAAAMEEKRRYVAAQLDAGRAELAAVEAQYRVQAAALEELMATVATAQEQHQRLVEGMEAALAAAQRSRVAELDSLARYEAALERNKQTEAERFELWAELDAEITALEQRRDHLRGTGAGDTA